MIFIQSNLYSEMRKVRSNDIFSFHLNTAEFVYCMIFRHNILQTSELSISCIKIYFHFCFRQRLLVFFSIMFKLIQSLCNQLVNLSGDVVIDNKYFIFLFLFCKTSNLQQQQNKKKTEKLLAKAKILLVFSAIKVDFLKFGNH